MILRLIKANIDKTYTVIASVARQSHEVGVMSKRLTRLLRNLAMTVSI